MADDVTSTTAGGTDATTGSNRTKGSAGSGSRPNSRPDWACQAGRIADEFRSRNVVVIDLTSITPIVDYIVVATGTSGRQMRAVADEISRVFKAEGDLRLGIEGYDHDSSWILIDFGDIVIHLQDTDARLLYDLEGLWPDASTRLPPATLPHPRIPNPMRILSRVPTWHESSRGTQTPFPRGSGGSL